jgi:hypothetical protein
VGLGSFDLLSSPLENSILFSLAFVQGDHTGRVATREQLQAILN